MTSLRISANIRHVYLKALFAQPISTLDVLPPGQTAAIITITANLLQVGISERLSILIQSISLVTTAIIIAFLYNWLLTLVTCSGLLFISIFYGVTTPIMVRLWKKVEEADRNAAGIAAEAFSSIRMIAACGAEAKMAKRYSVWVKKSERKGLRLSPLVAIQHSPGTLI
jgi:ATP-binding cassette, subfamily B (MDR/TAP), member 1